MDQETQTVINNLHIQPNGVVSSSIIQSFRHELQEAFDLAKNAKVDKYNEVVSIYNKALLTSIIVPIVDTVGFTGLPQIPKLTTIFRPLITNTTV